MANIYGYKIIELNNVKMIAENFNIHQGLQNLMHMHNFIKGLDLQVVENVEEAGFVLAHGTKILGNADVNAHSMKLEDMDRILDPYVSKGTPTVVTNPNYVNVEQEGIFRKEGS